MSAGQRKHVKKVRQVVETKGYFPKGDPEKTYCYCDAWGLTYPHYKGEHAQEHDDAQALRAERAGGWE